MLAGRGGLGLSLVALHERQGKLLAQARELALASPRRARRGAETSTGAGSPPSASGALPADPSSGGTITVLTERLSPGAGSSMNYERV